jgi:hypothetical protein
MVTDFKLPNGQKFTDKLSSASTEVHKIYLIKTHYTGKPGKLLSCPGQEQDT